jgi:branched-chain amino acid transport system substrate-binding protein
VAVDPNAVYYIGEFDSAASQISIPVLNQADVPQVSPTNTDIGLTTDLPGAAPGEPKAYYPTGMRTFLRLMPTDTVQAGALLLAMKQAGCGRVAVADDGAGSTGLATSLGKEKSIVYNTAVSANPIAFRSYAQTIRLLGADCFLYAGADVAAAAQLTREVNAVLPTARIFGSDRICSGAWTGPLPTGIDRLIECTTPTLRLSAYPGGNAFLAQYEARYGTSDPNVYAIYGYEAMKLGLDTITRLGPNGDSKSAVRAALFATRDRHSVLGQYGFDPNGDTTIRSYGLYHVGSGGNPVFLRTLTPPKTLP